ncbi:MAG: aminopeptidase P family protein [Gemmataceae bacterium]|nr:aminopeptidase P family protein [Gemmataceae bacterium]
MEIASSLRARRDAFAARMDHRGPVAVASGQPVPIAGTDQAHDFHAHPDFAYLGGPMPPGSVLTFDGTEGWLLFAPVASQDERIWSGDSGPLDELGARAGVDRVRPVSELGAWLERRRGLPLALLGNADLEHEGAAYGVSWGQLEASIDREAGARLTELLAEARRTKDPAELKLMREAVRASRAGHLLALRTAAPGMTERALQVEVEAEFFRNGAARTAYGSIVAAGDHGAVLHFAPTARPLSEGELVLMDAGAEVDGYASDVTRTFPVGRKVEGAQRDLYQLVLAVQERAIAAARPGKEYRELHLEAAEQIAAGLADLGILRGNPASLVEQDAHALFFPHGLGHMLGLSTHDAGGCLGGRTKSDRFGLKWLRADLPLQPGYVVTIEPGIYFIRALLEDPEWRARYRDTVDWARVDTMLDFGGIRIEDDVLITEGEANILSIDIPKGMAAVEALREEAFSR